MTGEPVERQTAVQASEERSHVTGVDLSLNGGFTWDGCLGVATKNPLRRNARQLMLAPTENWPIRWPTFKGQEQRRPET